ncbi:MAG: TonB-dependent receptor [Pseudomonadota bacterium]
MKETNYGTYLILIVLLLIGSFARVYAQAAESPLDDAQDGFVIEEMIVTAQRRSQSIQSVANSIEAIAGDDLDELQKVGLEDYINSIAGAGFTRNANGSVKVGLRGISAIAQDEYAFSSTTSTTGMYLDDVAVQGAGALPDLNLYDLQRIEVLKGPQGTLYGEGAMGGAIKLILNKPDLNEFTVKGEITGIDTKGADLGHRVRGAVNIPLVEGRLAARIVGSQESRKGWIDNIATGEDGVNDIESWSLRVALLAQITDAFSAELLVMHDQQDVAGFGQEVDILGDLETNLLEKEYNDTEFDIYALTLKYDLGFAELTSISSWFERERDFAQRVPFSIDEFILPLAMLPPLGFSANETLSVYEEVDTLSQELRLVSQGDSLLDWTVGAFYRDRDRDVCTPYDSPGGFALNGLLGSLGLGALALPQTTFDCERLPITGLDIFNRTAEETFEQFAVYGEINWAFTDTLELTAGARYFDEEVEFTDDQLAFSVFSFLTVPASTNSTSDSDVLFKLGLSWAPADNQLYYVNVAEGFRSGGANLNATITTDPGRFRTFESDDLINYELGAKTSWFDDQLTLNATLFYSDWSDIQSDILVPAITTPTVSVLTEGGDAEIQGAEVQLNYRSSNWLMGLSATLQDASFTDPAPNANIVEDSQLPNAPDLTASAFARYSHDMRMGELFAHLEYRYVDEQRTEVEPVIPTSPLYDDDLTILDSYDVINLTLGLRAERWHVTAFVQNLTDERYAVDYGYGLSFFVGGFNPNMTALGTPRTVGLTIGAEF